MHWFHKVSENDIKKVGKKIYKGMSVLEAFPKRVMRGFWKTGE